MALSSPSRRSGRIGRSLTWLCGGALGLNLVLVLGLVGILAWYGLGYFWQKPLVEFVLDDDTRILGEIHERELIPAVEPLADGSEPHRIRIKSGNRDLGGLDFRWVDESRIREQRRPEVAVALERLEYGNFYGYPEELRAGEEILARGRDEVWQALEPLLEEKEELRASIRDIEKGELEQVTFEMQEIRFARRRVELDAPPEEERAQRLAELDQRDEELDVRFGETVGQMNELDERLTRETLVMQTADGRSREIAVGHVVRAVRPNALTAVERCLLYLGRIREFLLDEPRESNTEGGVFPAIFGTVMMVFLMSFAAVPLGVLAALYLHEYARQGVAVRAVRIAVNNLAGVPSIVFGIFGLGFFVYLIGGTIDQLFYPEALPRATYGTGGILWASLTLALLTVPVVIVATEEGLSAVPRAMREGSFALGANRWETTWRVVIPASAPGILTGVILAVARAAGEVAPLMIVGMVKLAPALPVDGHAPFIHLERKFMHLGFHIYDLGFQSPNVEAARPLVFATALLLVLLVLMMNMVATTVRNHLRRKYATSAV